MKTDHIPILSYVFIGITSLVLTYATIADTTNEIILPPPTFVEASVAPESQSSSVFSAVPAIALPTLSGTIEKLKSLNPFSNAAAASGQEEIPVAVAVAVPVPEPSATAATTEPSAPPLPINKIPSSGGKKSTKNRKRKQKKTRRSSK